MCILIHLVVMRSVISLLISTSVFIIIFSLMNVMAGDIFFYLRAKFHTHTQR